MINTAQNLRNKSEALKKSVQTILGELKNTNNEIVAQMQINEASVEQHRVDIEQLGKDNEDLSTLHKDNETFIKNVEGFLG